MRVKCTARMLDLGAAAIMSMLLCILAVGCAGNRSPILGNAGGAAGLIPSVTQVAPANQATGVPVFNTVITASFSEPMSPLTGGASFTVTTAGTMALETNTINVPAM